GRAQAPAGMVQKSERAPAQSIVPLFSQLLGGVPEGAAEPALPPFAAVVAIRAAADPFAHSADGLSGPAAGIVLRRPLQRLLFQAGQDAGEDFRRRSLGRDAGTFFDLGTDRFKPKIGIGQCAGAGGLDLRGSGWVGGRVPIGSPTAA